MNVKIKRIILLFYIVNLHQTNGQGSSWCEYNYRKIGPQCDELRPSRQQKDDWKWNDALEPGGFPDPTETACEGNRISLRCPGSDVIQVTSASYGRQNSFTCSGFSNEQVENTECSLPGAKQILETRCNNKTECNLMVSSDTFDDPCTGTRKYLKTSYKCLKFMFQCPGSLIGIGRGYPSVIDVQPQAAAWTKDPLNDRNYVYFASTGQTVHEYSTWTDFVNGRSNNRYSLPSNMARGNFIVYDTNLYYVKANSRNIVRYSLMTRFRTKEAPIPGSRLNRDLTGGDITLAVDENGIWVTFTKSINGAMTISKLDKTTLEIKQSWATIRRISDSLHTFVICGVLYSVSSHNGKVDYSFNTNVKANREKTDLDISFSAPGRRLAGRRRSLRYNATFLSYNPRDQLIYSWEASTASAVYYKLTFDGLDPKVAITSTTTTTTTTTQTTRTPSTIKITSKYAPVTSSTPTATPPIIHDVDSCPPTNRGRISWPKTKAGETARISCNDGTGGYAAYQCVRQQSMRQADWFVTGPDLSQCITWATEIQAKYKTSELDRATALSDLLRGLQEHGVTEKSLQFTAKLITELLKDKTIPSKPAAKLMLSVLSKIDDELMKSEEPWNNLTVEKQTETAMLLMEATEKMGFFYADLVSSEPRVLRDNDPLVMQGEELLIQVEIRSKTAAQIASRGVTIFPDDAACGNEQKCLEDRVKILDSEIMDQPSSSRKDPSTVVFALYQNLGDYLGRGDEQDWILDSKVISATFTQPNSKTMLSAPVTVVLHHKKQERKARRCVFWDPDKSQGKGSWSVDGCHKISSNASHTTCQCDHLSSFAVQVDKRGYSSQTYYDPTLDVITKIGISISAVCLLLCVLTLTCFRNLRIDRNVVHQNFCVCLLVVELLFLIGINQTSQAIFCTIVAALLHYFFIATFAWISLESIQLYSELGDVANKKSRSKWWNYVAAYGIPLVIVGISVGIGRDSYGTGNACWIEIDSGLIWTLVGPIALLILINLFFLSMTVCKMYKNSMAFNDSGRINSVKAAVRGASVLLCLLGITWAFGVLWLSEGNSILAYLFCVFNAFQGIFIFIFYCLLPKKVRHEYTRCLASLPCCRKFGRDYVSNSMSFSKQYGSGRYSNGTNAGSQQTTLNGQSQIRRLWNEAIVTPKNSQSTPVVNDAMLDREPSRTAPCSHRSGSQHANHNATDPSRQRQEDDVFLPSDVEKDNRSENARLLHNPQGEIEYDRLQYYRCPDHYSGRVQRSYSPQGNHHPPLPPQRHMQSPPISPPTQLVTSHFGGPYQSRSPGLQYEPSHPQINRQDPAHPYYWELDPPLAQHHHVHQSSIEENASSGKRDSGISMQHLPPNSMIHRFASDMQRCDMHRSRDSPISPVESHSSSRQSPPVRIQEEALHHSQLHHHHPRYPQIHKRGALSDDEGQGLSFEDQENGKNISNSKSEILKHRGTTHTGRGISPPVKLEKPKPLLPEQGRAGLPSDSDDPIVTDCSGSSAASSFGRHYRSWANQENMV